MKQKVNFGVIIQARMGSTRLPNKILLSYKKITPLGILIKRLKKSKYIDDIFIATTRNEADKKIVTFCKKNYLKYFKGSTNNVLSRYHYTAKKFKIDNIIRVTSDCPLVDYRIIDQMIKIYKKKEVDYLANTYPLPTKYPDGMDIEIFTKNTLLKSFNNASLPSEKEHVTPYMWKYNKFKICKKNYKTDLSKYRFCLDYPKDFKLLCRLIDIFKSKIYDVSMEQIVNLIKKNKNLVYYQRKIKRNEGWASSLKKDNKYKK
jgi:spore coat polysaccharide biosynthesis protein SpsF